MSSARLTRRDGFKPKLIALSVAACFSVSATQSSANPTGGTVASGSASFASSGNTLTVTNTANAIINWQSFSIGVNEITRFLQSSGSSAVLNRVVGVNGAIPQSGIDGILSSNGRVFLLNSSGIAIGATARIDVAGFVASSLSLSDADFLAGRMRFTETPGAGGVSNAGVIDTTSGGPGGRVFLVGPDVQNSGVIRSPQGDIILAAGKSVELVAENTPFVTVNITADSEQALNVGQLLADSGRIGMFGALVRQGGVAQANSAVVGANGEIRLVATQDLTLDAGSVTTANGPSGGNITLQAQGGTNLISGTVEAKGSSGQGGTIQALGVRVGVIGNGVIDASGDTGGGTVLVGGDAHGANPNIQNADRTFIGSDGVIRADAGTTGDGGRVVVWAAGDTRFYGSISAQGGAQSGNGGFVETSGKLGLDVGGHVNAGAPNGQGGSWLIDPTDVSIVSGPNGLYGVIGDVSTFGAAQTYGGQITVGTLQNQFTLGPTTNVYIQATNNVGFYADLSLTYSGTTPKLFEVRAQNNIDLAGHTITTNGQNVTLSANDAGAAYASATLNTAAGTYGSITGGGNIFTNYGGAAFGGISLSGYGVNVGTLGTTGGAVTISALSGGVTTGNIATSGPSGTDFSSIVAVIPPTAGGAGGSISISAAYGAVVTGNIDAIGGRGGNGGASSTTVYAGQFGGSGGSVTIGLGANGPTTSITTGSIAAYGGYGGIGANNSLTATGTADGGSGGIGGTVSLSSTTGAVTVGAINTSGGIGGNGANSYGAGYAGAGGAGGNGGGVDLSSTYGLVNAGTILTSSGNAGTAGVALAGPAAGVFLFSNFSGAVTISAGDSVTTSAINTSGGSAGNGGAVVTAAPLGGSGGTVSITATNAVSTGAIDTHGGAGGNAGVAGATLIGDTGSGGDVTLTGSSVTTGAIDASGGAPGAISATTTTGDIITGSITSRALSPVSPIGGTVSLTTAYGRIIVNGNIDVRGADGSGTQIDNCGDGCLAFYYGGSYGGIALLQRTGAANPTGGTAVQVSGSILAYGGNGFNPQNAAGGSGGQGGDAAITSVYGGAYGSTAYGAIIVAGSIDVHGGYGGAGGFGYGGGAGGYGGIFELFGDAVSSGAVNAAGGAGGTGGADNGTAAGSGGVGGNGGTVALLGLGTGTVAVGNISVSGGNGGLGGNGSAVAGGVGGSGGYGGTISVVSGYGSIDMTTGGTITLAGGTGGAGGNSSSAVGGNGGAGGNSGSASIDAYGSILLTAGLTVDGVSIPTSGTSTSTSIPGGLGGAPGVTGGVAGAIGLPGSVSILGGFTTGGTGTTSSTSAEDTLTLAGNTVIQGTNQLVLTNNAPSADDLQKKNEENKKKKEAAACK